MKTRISLVIIMLAVLHIYPHYVFGQNFSRVLEQHLEIIRNKLAIYDIINGENNIETPKIINDLLILL